MREFSDSEKEVLKYLVENEHTFEDGFILNHNFQNSTKYLFYNLNGLFHININEVSHTLDLFFREYKKDDSLRIKQKNVLSSILLFKYLESQCLIVFSQVGNSHQYTIANYKNISDEWYYIKDYRNIKISWKSISFSTFLDQDFERYYHSHYIISDELKQFVRRKFKTREQQYIEKQLEESRKQTEKANTSIIISGIVLVLSTLTFLFSITFK